jgi:hypothetical protein
MASKSKAHGNRVSTMDQRKKAITTAIPNAITITVRINERIVCFLRSFSESSVILC